MFRIGLTGNIAGGKSSVARVWERLGAPVIDADELARRAVEPGSPGLARVVREFGPTILAEGGRLDRAALRDIVFHDPAARARLEAAIHPEIARLRAAREAELREAGAHIVVHDIPLLFEVGLEYEFDAIVLVDAPAATRLRRLIRGRGLDEDDARRMIEAQMPAAAKRARSDIVIDNRGGLPELEAEAERVWRELERQSRASG